MAAQCFEIFFVIKPEGCVVEDADAYVFRFFPERYALGRLRTDRRFQLRAFPAFNCAGGGCDEPMDINVVCDVTCELFKACVSVFCKAVPAAGKAHMTFRQRIAA